MGYFLLSASLLMRLITRLCIHMSYIQLILINHGVPQIHLLDKIYNLKSVVKGAFTAVHRHVHSSLKVESFNTHAPR